MKKFLFRLSLFAGILTVLVGGLCCAEIVAEISAYRSELVAPEGADAVVCSASKSERALDPGVWPGIFNFSASGRAVDQVYLTAIDLFAANPGRFRHFILEVSPEVVREDPTAPLRCLGFSAQYYLLHLLHRDEGTRPLDGIVKVARDNLAGRRLRDYSKALRGKKPFRSALGGGFSPSTRCGRLSEPDWFKARVERVRRECDPGLDAFDPDAPALSVIARTIDLAQSNGADVVILSCPWHRDLLAACGSNRVERFSALIRAFAAERNCRYLDLSRMDLPDDCWVDGNHVNVKGARSVTSIVRDFVDRAAGAEARRTSEAGRDRCRQKGR